MFYFPSDMFSVHLRRLVRQANEFDKFYNRKRQTETNKSDENQVND